MDKVSCERPVCTVLRRKARAALEMALDTRPASSMPSAPTLPVARAVSSTAPMAARAPTNAAAGTAAMPAPSSTAAVAPSAAPPLTPSA